MANPKRQHWVPRFYLKYFAIPDSIKRGNPQVYVVNRLSGAPSVVAIGNIAVQNHLYSPVSSKDAGTRDFSREHDLAELDGLLSRIWPQLAEDYLDLSADGFRKGLSLFLAVLFLRHPNSLHRQREARAKLVQFIESGPKDKDGFPSAPGVLIGRDRKRFALSRDNWPSLRDATPDDEHAVFVDSIRASATEIATELMHRRWSIVMMDDPLLVTSDTPFFCLDPDKKTDQILGRGATLMFPITPRRLLWIDERNAPANQYYRVPAKEAGFYNMMTWVNTGGFMISPRDTDDVLIEIGALSRQRESENAGHDKTSSREQPAGGD